MWTDNLRQFHFWCQKTLPLVYDDSLSYYEVLAKVTKHLNELTTLVNEIGDELERYEGVTDDRLDTLETWRTEVDTWRAQINQWREDVDTWREDVDTWREQTDDWKQSTENHLTAHDNWISYATGLINNTIMPFIEDMTTRVADIENRLSGAENDIDTLQSDVTSLDSRLDDAESSIVGLDSRLDTAEGDITSLDGRLDTAEGDISDIQDDVTDLQNRMSTAETNLVGLNEALRIISITVKYDQTAQVFKAFCTTLGDESFIRDNITDAKISGSVFGFKVRFIMRMTGSTPYDYSNIYLYDSYGNAIQYEGSVAYLNMTHSTHGAFLNGIDTRHLYLLDTHWTNALSYSLSGEDTGQLPIPTNPSGDDGKVVAYNHATRSYALITPGGSSHTYSTTEHEVGTWIDGSTVYEQTLTGSWSSDTTTNIQIPQGVTVLELQGFVYRTDQGSSSHSYYPIYSGDMWIDSDTSQIGVIHSIRNWGSLGTNKYFVTIRYVKELYRP